MLVGLSKPVADTKVAVAMSGGVDSSTVAALLNEFGYQVIGVTLQLYDDADVSGKKNACCAGQDIYDAKQAADTIGIPHYVLNYETRFKSSVIDYFVDSYIAGSTPIPCIKCNQGVKFTDLLNFAKDLGVDCLATGHYVRKLVSSDNQIQLHKGVDGKKDQSYFLFATTMSQLAFLQFPIGGMDKTTTRLNAKRLGLKISDKPDSQDICFVQGSSYADLVRKLRPDSAKAGKIIHVDGYQVGYHDGIINYTIGQRKGIKVSDTQPLYVVKIDAKKNVVYVGYKKHLYWKKLKLQNVNLLCEVQDLTKLDNLTAKIRYKHESVPVSVQVNNEAFYVNFADDQQAISKGQACVFYNGSRVLGGGWIE